MQRKPNSECQIMVFHPTIEEFSDFSRYIQYMESQGAHRGGVAKIIPPKEWIPCKNYDHVDDVQIPAPISQVVTGQKGLYTQYNIQQKSMTVKELRKLANTDKYISPFHESYEDLERTYWKNITFNPAIYGADISGSLYDANVDIWNVARLNTILDLVENDTGVKIEGVNTAYLYFGMWKTSFAWHTEDMELYSINYVHFGAPKTWYAVPPEHGKRLERLATGFFPNSKSTCSAFLRHKMTVISPSVLRQFGIPFNKVTQEAGEFMITFPFGYHSGFNHGFNCAESTNFASERWINYGLVAEKCKCRKDMVFINMDMFVKTFQPDIYDSWKMNKHDVKLSYIDIPPVPDFSEKPIHWRERIEKLRESNACNTKSENSPKKIMQQNGSSKPHNKDNQSSSISSSSRKKRSQSRPVGITKSFVKLERNNFSNLPQGDPDSLEKEDLNKLSLTFKCKTGCSGSSLHVPYSESSQLTMGSVLSQTFFSTHDTPGPIRGSRTPPHYPTLFDRIKMKRRKPFHASCDEKNHQGVMKTDYAKTLNHQITALPINSDHTMYTKHRKQCIATDTSLGSFNAVSTSRENNSISPLTSSLESVEKTVLNTQLDQSETSTSNILESNSSAITTSFEEDVFQENNLKIKEQTAVELLVMMKIGKEPTIEADSQRQMSKTYSPSISNRSQLKRRHPVSKKGPSKKSSPTPVLRSTSADSDSSAEETDMKGKHASPLKQKTTTIKEGYPVLWLPRKSSFRNEKRYNTTVAKLPPYCAVCTLFQPYYEKSIGSFTEPPALETLLNETPQILPGTRTKPLIPEINFATSINNPKPLAICKLLDEDGKSRLVQCKDCMVQVHASCYGVEKLPQPNELWTCDRCCFKAWIAQCTLCCLRGGALKPVNDGLQWAHVLCSVAIPEVSFDDIPRRNGINISKLSPTRRKLKCTYCKRNKSRSLQTAGTCIQCCAGTCAVSFHATCAHAAGVKMETGDWPLPVFVYCQRHALLKKRVMQTKADKNLSIVEVGQTVFGKHKNGRYYPCVIRSENSSNFHHVVFADDNSWSDNLFQQDIISHDFDKSPPKEGDIVQVMWTDGKVYNAHYKECKKQQVLMVEFEDCSILSLKREEMYTSIEDMPTRIKRKLSTATNMCNLDHLHIPVKIDKDFNASKKTGGSLEKKMETVSK